MRPHRRQPTRLPRPWDSPGRNTGVGCHYLLQCMKVKSEREVAQSCLTLSNPMDRSPPGSPSLGFSSRSTGVGAIAFPVQAVQLGHKQTKRPSSALSPDAQALKTSIFCRGAALAASSFATCFEPCHHHQLFCSLFSKSVLANFIRISI